MNNSRSLQHIAIIPDGNRRWSRATNTPLEQTYFSSCEKLFNVSKMFFGKLADLKEISLFFVSLQNLMKRRADELDALFTAGLHFVDLFYSHSKTMEVQLRWIGLHERDFVVPGIRYNGFIHHIKNLDTTLEYPRKVNILIGYDVRRDIERAMRETDCFDYRNLEVTRPVDLIIRTGGTRRLSGFLPLACQYADFVFIDELFPSVAEEEFILALSQVAGVARNFGT